MAYQTLSNPFDDVHGEERCCENCEHWGANCGGLTLSEEMDGTRLKMARCLCEDAKAPLVSMPTGDAVPFTSAGACCPGFSPPAELLAELAAEAATYRNLDLYLARQI
jgi:hypothetical protein